MIRFTLCLALLPLPATAQTFGLPPDCTAYLTVQKRGCTVSHLFTCEGDPAGHQRRADLGEEGLQYVGQIDAETQWIESWHVEADSTERLLPGAVDPASFTELTSTGRDSFDFMTLSNDLYETIFRGQDELTGETVVIDGVTLERTAFQVTAFDPAGNELWRTSGNEFISREWRTFFSGTRTTVNSTETFEADGTPMEFIFPGEEGFLASSPRHDCGALMSKAGLADPLAPERN